MIGIDWTTLGVAFGLCVAISALGFIRVDYFVSLGYAFSIAAQGLLLLVFSVGRADLWALLQITLLTLYGVRLGSYLMARETSPSFARELEASRERGRRVRGPVRFAIWLSVALLYVAMFSPALFVSTANVGAATAPDLPIGVLVMVLGLAIEALADLQKSRFKAENPARFCDVGLYRFVRCPNYFGEMVFWIGAFVSGLSAYSHPLDWLLAGAGLVCIQLIMLGSARRLEIKQAERYSGDPSYRAYVERVPVLFPLVPLFSLRKLRVYLG